MNRIICLFIALITLNSCEKEGIRTSSTNNCHFQVSLLFEHEGIKVYRFYDGSRYHYFTSKGECMSTQSFQSGKTRVYFDENI